MSVHRSNTWMLLGLLAIAALSLLVTLLIAPRIPVWRAKTSGLSESTETSSARNERSGQGVGTSRPVASTRTVSFPVLGPVEPVSTPTCESLVNLQEAGVPPALWRAVLAQMDPVTEADAACLRDHPVLQMLVYERGEEEGWAPPDVAVESRPKVPAEPDFPPR
jgi:hypothetical protein